MPPSKSTSDRQCSRPVVVVSSYSFAPRQGSESGTGWETVKTLSSVYEVYVVCAKHYQSNFVPEDFTELKAKGITVVFFDHEPLLWLLKLPGPVPWTKIYYLIWQKRAGKIFEKLIFDHKPVGLLHATWGTGRVTTSLVDKGVPVIFGPVGGFESGSPAIDRGLGIKNWISERLRRFHIKRSLRSRTLSRMYEKIDLVLACTQESEESIRQLGARRIERMTNAGVSAEKAKMLGSLRQNYQESTELKLLFASRFVGWKGEELAIRAIAEVNDRPVKLTMLGHGKNLHRCKKLAIQLKVTDRVEFIRYLPEWDDVWSLFANSDGFVFPSLHDSGGTSVLEAMAAELPVVCLDLGGPAEFIDSACGYKISAGPVSEVVSAMATAIRELHDFPEQRRKMGKEASRRCLALHTWDTRGTRLLTVANATFSSPSNNNIP